jgi:phosphopantothenoylcysteine decarboxylase / phosphopantothenate---cysteine ligase
MAQKLKKTDAGPPALALAENPDILRTIAMRKTQRPKVVVGFAAETDDLVAHAQAKLKAKGCDLIVANSVAPGTGTFGGNYNQVFVIGARDTVSWPHMSKDEVARKLIGLCVELSDKLL